MTDTSSSSTTQPLLQQIPVTAPVLSHPTVNGSLSDTLPPEEDYTIKCICDFEDDDGNTVFCEACETWQHIECYYHGKKVPEIHNCADCEPRPLDGKRATERQRRLREQNTSNNNESGDRKAKRPATKSHKKKIKDANSTPEQVNGWSHARHDSQSMSRDQPPPAKRPKTNHRTSGSVSSQTSTPILSHETHKRAGSTHQTYPSPSKSPSGNGPHMPLYSNEFLRLYDDDPGDTQMQSNVHNSITAANALSSWLKDPQALAAATDRSRDEIFQFSDQQFDSSKWPKISKQTKTDPSFEFEGRHPTWKYLRVEADVRKDQVVGEVKGHIGLLQEYCLDEANRFKDLRHPEPFVFFHPYLPIYIDARKEGTLFRYVRRSCRPNLTLKTYITNGVEYHFCFVAREDIPAGTEVTAMWYLDPKIFKDEGAPEEDPDLRPMWVSQFLANFGDCACTRPPPCSFSRVDLRQPPPAPGTKMNGKRKRMKPKQGVSPMSTGHATNSRAGSEALRIQDDDDMAESRSTSGSARSKPQSRDLTPTSGVATDGPAFPGVELSERERRKTAAVERLFQQQDNQQHGQKKKKRSSGGALHSGQGGSITQAGHFSAMQPNPANPYAKPDSADSSTIQGDTGSPPAPFSNRAFRNSSATPRGSNPSPRRRSAPNTPHVSSPLAKPSYVDMAIQCDRDEFDPEYDKPFVCRVPAEYLIPSPPSPRTPYVSPFKRFVAMAKKAKEDSLTTDPTPPWLQGNSKPLLQNLPGPITPEPPLPNGIPIDQTGNDVEMVDADATPTKPATPDTIRPSESHPETSTVERVQSNMEATFKAPPPPWPSSAAHNTPLRQPLNGYRATDLRVQLPPTPHFSNLSPSPSTASQITPISSSASVGQPPWNTPSASSPAALQTPGSSVVTPSPVKKKLSLGDYMSRRSSNLGPAGERPGSLINQTQPPQTDPSAKIANVAMPAPTIPKPSESLAAETKEQGAEGSAIIDTPMTDVGDLIVRSMDAATQSTKAIDSK